MQFDFSGKNVLVTGGSRGIGLETAKLFAEANANVAIVASTQENAQKALQHFSANALPKAFGANMKSKQELAELLVAVDKNWDKIDVFVHAAAITRDNLFVRMSEQDWQDVIDTNLHSTFYLTQAIAKKMMKSRFGRIVLLTSVVGYTGNAGQANYASSKAALSGFCKSVSKELAARNVCINLIAPGFIETDMTAGLKPELKQAILQQIPAKRMGTSKEVAYGALCLSSDMASYITGTTLHINGGMY